MATIFEADRAPLGLVEKLRNINWGLIALLGTISCIGFAVLFSAAGGNLDPWADHSMMRFVIGLCILLVVAVIDLRFWYQAAYPLYAISALLLVAVDLKGTAGKGAQRWLDLGPLSLQPSELMKIGLILVLARYFSTQSHSEIGKPWRLIYPVFLILVPAALVMKQPDLGTAMMLVMCSGALFFLAGVRLWKFLLVGSAGAAMVPVAWNFLRDYQKNRILTFLNPENDSLGAGYHIMQSKIALGSGGMWGKGFMMGTQSHLSFLPEKQTDFIFTMFAEEFGMAGGLVLLGLYALVVAYGFAIGLRCRNQFGKLLALGLVANFFLYFFINTAMVMGLIPVVGVPLPLISYGGTAMLTLMFGFGLVVCVWIHRDLRLNRSGRSDL
jgi:rod shape determining protein RodA